MSDMPVYSTRPAGDGTIGTFRLSPGLALTIFILVALNIVGWSIFGLVALVAKAVESLG